MHLANALAHIPAARGRRHAPSNPARRHPPAGSSAAARRVYGGLLALAAAMTFGCAASRAPVAGDPPRSAAENADALLESGTPRQQLEAITLLQESLLECEGAESQLPSMREIIYLDSALGDERSTTVPAELVAVMRDEIIRARTSEPFWNDVHYSCGFLLGFAGVPPDEALDVLDGWEQFEHHSPMGRRFGMSLDEGVFGYIWDLQHGMDGHGAGVAYRRGEGRTLSDANPDVRRGGYAN